MEQKLIGLIASIIAACIIMMLHELIKAMVYNVQNKEQSPQSKRNIYKIHHYIDPIGLILCVTTSTGFSKPYMYRIKDKRTNFRLGIAGFVTLLAIFGISLFIYKSNYPQGAFAYDINNRVDFFVKYFWYALNSMFVLLSMTMIIVNLFPVSTFDMGLLIAGKSPSKYFSIIKNDQYIKAILILTIIFDIIRAVSFSVINLFV
ncbi:hypothetical protein [Anaeromicropila herbilytica]|uniref:Peptidase M50 domain-containing protein n=1 Tax=Anaeromicropila herbilytica TaxID=2785025 RepID=A0A7R7EMC3_9FIRM|nr:hypothetical protein [Anaeromicropila herbilytica]BCN31394.1 hypothetical protein bsdtb5_26890 [Anaeromicropila herbilytica]